MPVEYNIARTFKLSGDDDRRLHEIMDAVGLKQAEALRFGLEVAVAMLQHAVERDPEAVFVEYQHAKGRTAFPEKMSEEEKEEALSFVRHVIGGTRFDKLMQQGRELIDRRKKDGALFAAAKDLVLSRSEGPFSAEELIRAIKEKGGAYYSLAYAKGVFDREWKKGEQLKQVAPGKYCFMASIKQEVKK